MRDVTKAKTKRSAQHYDLLRHDTGGPEKGHQAWAANTKATGSRSYGPLATRVDRAVAKAHIKARHRSFITQAPHGPKK